MPNRISNINRAAHLAEHVGHVDQNAAVDGLPPARWVDLVNPINWLLIPGGFDRQLANRQAQAVMAAELPVNQEALDDLLALAAFEMDEMQPVGPLNQEAVDQPLNHFEPEDAAADVAPAAVAAHHWGDLINPINWLFPAFNQHQANGQAQAAVIVEEPPVNQDDVDDLLAAFEIDDTPASLRM